MKRGRVFFTLFFILLTEISFPQANSNFSKIDLMILQEDYRPAIIELNKIIELDSTNSEAYYKLGLAYQGNYQNNKAISVLQKIAKFDSTSAIQLLLAKSYYNLGYLDNAEKTYSTVFKTDSASKSTAINLAKIYQDKLKYKAALGIYNYLLKQDSSDAFINKQLAFCLMKLDSLELSLKFYQRSLNLNPEDVSSAVQMATICSKLGRQDSALQFVDYGLSYFPDEPNFNKIKAEILFKKDDYKAAIECYQKVIQLGDSTFAVYQNLGYSYYFFANEDSNFKASTNYLKDKNDAFEKAVNALEKSYKLGNENHYLCYYAGQAADKINNLDKAIFFYNEVVRLTVPTFIDKIYKLLGLDYQITGKYDESVNAYKKSLFYNPGDKDLIINIAMIYSETLKDKSEAIKYFEAYLKDTDESMPGLRTLAELKIKQLKNK